MNPDFSISLDFVSTHFTQADDKTFDKGCLKKGRGDLGLT